MKRLCYFMLVVVATIMASCNKDNVIEEEIPLKPVVTFDNGTGVYSVKKGHTITISPTVANADGATFTWTIDSKIVSRTRELTVSFSEVQTVYATLQVIATGGTAEEDVEIDVVDAAAPVISLAIPEGGVKVLAGQNYLFDPDFLYDDDTFSCEWQIDGKSAGKERSFTFNQSQKGNYTVTLIARNEDGTTQKDIAVEVVDQLPYSVTFPTPSYFQTTTDRSAVVGRPLYLRPLLTNIDNPKFEWAVDGVTVSDANERTLKYTPAAAGDKKITVKVSDGSGKISAQAEVTVHCYAAEGTQRAASASSQTAQNKVYEYLPAPGQFVGDATYSAFTGNETTIADATAYAERRLKDNLFVTLGAFGGYIVVGFDHSIANSGGDYDFTIAGNAFSGSSEPGVVWVMQDTNGNGLPDDEWYELRGSETGKSTTIQDYEITYYRAANGCAVHWSDSEGATGSVDYLGEYHSQPTYYPAWVSAESYTLRGTRLGATNSLDSSTGYWSYKDLDYGYADNYGTDRTSAESTTGSSTIGFKLSNAMNPDGSAVSLKFVDFVKVQTAVNAKSGIIGECSTEILGCYAASVMSLTRQVSSVKF